MLMHVMSSLFLDLFLCPPVCNVRDHLYVCCLIMEHQNREGIKIKKENINIYTHAYSHSIELKSSSLGPDEQVQDWWKI